MQHGRRSRFSGYRAGRTSGCRWYSAWRRGADAAVRCGACARLDFALAKRAECPGFGSGNDAVLAFGHAGMVRDCDLVPSGDAQGAPSTAG